MNNLQKMNQMVNSTASKEQVAKWAYMNRITVFDLQFEEEFESMTVSINSFIDTYNYHGKCDEHKAWDDFLDAEYVG